MDLKEKQFLEQLKDSRKKCLALLKEDNMGRTDYLVISTISFLRRPSVN